MHRFNAGLIVMTAVTALGPPQAARASSEWKITIPRRSHLSLVQRLNREGVEAVQKHEYEKAEALFLKAFLYDPADPFTLNNIGYISELNGQVDRARRFYKLAAQQDCNAQVDMSSAKHLEGKTMMAALSGLQDAPMRVNHMNLDAMQLVAEERGTEAEAMLHQSLSLDPENPFTLNNLGVAEEAMGNLDEALRYYHAAADLHSNETVVEASNRSWRGTPVSQLAAANAARVQSRMQGAGTDEERVATLSIDGVRAVNRNDWTTARRDFLTAYRLSPENAFSLNNRGFVAEKEGDLESAQFFYEKARKANLSDMRVGFATRLNADGKSLSAVAGDSDSGVESALAAYSRQRRREAGPIELIPRADDAAPPPQQMPH